MNSEEDLLTFIAQRIHERQHGGEFWLEGWDPRALVSGTPFDCLLNCELEQGFGDDPAGAPGDKILRLRRGDPDPILRLPPAIDTQRIAQGDFLSRTLQERLCGIYKRHGNVHWGNQTDLSFLSERLRVGFFVFTDVAQDGAKRSRWLASYNVGRHDYPYWIALYNQGNAHFQLLSLTPQAAFASRTCAWHVASIPAPLCNQYRVCTGSSIGDSNRIWIS